MPDTVMDADVHADDVQTDTETMTTEEIVPGPSANAEDVPITEAATEAEAVATEDVATENGVKAGTDGSEAVVAAPEAVAAAPDALPPAEPVVVVEEKKELTDEEKLWNTVKSNAADFTAWVTLIQETERNIGEDFGKLRYVYDLFLAEFPLCYGYWKKYADHEARNGEPGKVDEVYERAVVAVAFSVDIWMHYSVYKSKTATDPEEVRSLYERGLVYVGSDYLAHILWDKYLDYEQSKEEWVRVAGIYTRILQQPLQQLDRYWKDFKSFVSSHSLDEIRTPDEIAAAAAPEPAPPAAGDETEVLPDDEAPKAGKTDEEQREEYIAVREGYYRASKERDAKIKEYESLIKRPYFHVKPLDELQLSVWHRYLDFVEKEEDFGRIVKLFERCVIPAASYPEFWIRYVTRLEASDSLDRAAEALGRATTIFVKRRPEIHLFAAKFKEQHGDVPGARAEYQLVTTELAPGLVEAVIRFANLERREGNADAGCAIYEAAVLSEKPKDDSRTLPYLYLQYARYLDQAAGKTEKAREVYTQAIEKSPTSKSMWQAVLTFEATHPGEDRVKRVKGIAEQAVASARPDGTPSLTAADREEISAMAVEFIDLFGTAADFKDIEAWHKSHFPPRRSGTSESKKRAAGEMGSDRSTKHHKGHGGQYHNQGNAGGYTNGQWGAQGNYGAQGGGYGSPAQQGWQQGPGRGPPAGGVAPAPQAQQGWGGYQQQAPQQQPPPQQAMYGGYNTGGYGYAPPAAQAPAPQQAAYAGYAPQPYVAPAAAAPQAYAQQPAYGAAPIAAAPAAQQAYYPPAQQAYYPQQ